MAICPLYSLKVAHKNIGFIYVAVPEHASQDPCIGHHTIA